MRGAWLEDGVVRPVTFIDPPSHWLLVPMTTKMLDQLAAVGADLEDLEEDDPGEDDRTAEGFTWPERHEDQTSLTAPNGDDEEPSLGATIAMDQRDAWRVTDTTGSEYVDGEEDDEREPEPDGIPPRVRDFIQTMRARGDRPAVQVGTDGLNSSAFGRWLKL